MVILFKLLIVSLRKVFVICSLNFELSVVLLFYSYTPNRIFACLPMFLPLKQDTMPFVINYSLCASIEH